MRELETVHRTRHVDVGEDQVNVASLLKDQNGVVRAGRFDHVKTVGLDHLDRIHADQCLVFHNKHNRSLARSRQHWGSIAFFGLGGPTTGTAIAQIVGYPTLLRKTNWLKRDRFLLVTRNQARGPSNSSYRRSI